MSLRTSAAPPAVIAVAHTTAATLQAVAVPAPPATIALPPVAAAAPPPAPPIPSSFATSAKGPAPTGVSAANERRIPRSPRRYSRQPSHSRMCLRARPGALTPRSYAVIRSRRISWQSVSRAVCASTSPTRARTSSDLIAGDRDAERRGQVGVAHAVDLAHQERGALLLGQSPHVGDEPAQVLAPLGLVHRVEQRLARHLEDLARRRHGAAKMVDAAVVGDAVEPGADVDVALVAPQRAERADEDVLQDVLGVLARVAGQHLPHVGEQALAVALIERAECLVRPGTEQGDQLLVRAQPQERPGKRQAAQAARCV